MVTLLIKGKLWECDRYEILPNNRVKLYYQYEGQDSSTELGFIKAPVEVTPEQIAEAKARAQQKQQQLIEKGWFTEFGI